MDIEQETNNNEGKDAENKTERGTRRETETRVEYPGLLQHGARFFTFSLLVHHGASAVLSDEEFSLSAIMN